MPFWAWNSELDEDELARQIATFKEMGFGGFFMHSRVGLKTPYLGDKWFSCIRRCIESAKQYDMFAGLYDEDRWPSGTAGGMVTKKDEFKAKFLKCEIVTLPLPENLPGCTLGFFAVRGDEEKRFCRSYRELPENFTAADLHSGEFPVRIWFENEKNSSWFNGQTYVDTMNPLAVKEFINRTHEKYFSESGDEFGRTVSMIFTDEPCFLHFARMALPWTLSLPEKFEKEWKRDLLTVLPELFFDLPEKVSLTKWQFFNTVTGLFVNSFCRQIGNWCTEHNLKLTGHVLGEDSLTSQTAGVGAAMRFYEFMHIPGIDQLTEIWNVFISVKQCVSAARQFGKNERLSELYGCTGWEFPLSGHLALGDWQYALGINLRIPHLAHYSMAGEAKRDYPASISYQSPYHTSYRVVEDHFARLGATLKNSTEIRELLVIHPIESYWSTYLPFPEIIPAKRPENDREFEKLTMELLSLNLDFDYGDEEILSRIAKNENAVFKVGQADYKAVLLQPMLTIRATTLTLLKEFADNGGMVAYLGEIPAFVNGERSDAAKDVYMRNFTGISFDELSAALSPHCRRVSICGNDGNELHPMLSYLGKRDDFYLLFVNNFGKEFASDMMNEKRIFERNEGFDEANFRIKAEFAGDVYELDCDNGSIHKVKYFHDGKNYCFTSSFAPQKSRLFMLGGDVPEKYLIPGMEPLKGLKLHTVLEPEKWNFSCDEKNVLILDHADVKCDGELLWENYFILHADTGLRTILGGESRAEAMLQPYLVPQKKDEKKLRLQLDYTFDAGFIPDELFLAIEEPEKWHIILNGNAVSNTDRGRWWIDRAIKVLPLPVSALKTGKNHLSLLGDYALSSQGLEYIYILGNFSVKNDLIIPMQTNTSFGNWCEMGMPYYSGSVTCSTVLPPMPSGCRSFLEIDQWEGTLLKIQINDRQEKLITAHHVLEELTGDIAEEKENLLKVTVVSHRRNAMGPFYLPENWTLWNGSRAFNTYTNNAVKQLVPCGLLAAPVIKTDEIN